MQNMKKVLAVLLAVLMLCSVLPLSAIVSAAASSYDFESGDVSGWESSCNLAVVEDGGNLVLQWDASGASWANIYNYSSGMAANTDYTVSLKVKADRETNMNLKVLKGDWSGDTFANTFNVTTEWQEVFVDVSTGDGNLLMFSTNTEAANGATYYLDDIVVAEAGAGEPDAPVLEVGKVYNGDFANGADGWKLNGSASVEDGALKIDNCSQWAEAAMADVSVEAGKEYILTWKSKRISGSGAFMMFLLNGGNGNISAEGQNWMNSQSADWVEHSLKFTAPQNILRIKLSAEVANPGVILIDDIKLGEVVKPADPVVGQITNGGFETGDISGWNKWQSTAIESAAAKNGSFGAHIKGNGGWGGMLDQTFDVEDGKTYELSYWYKVNSNGFNMQFNGMQTGTSYASAWLQTGTWTQFTKTFVVSGDTQIKINFCGGGNGIAEDAYIDDVMIRELKEPSDDGFIKNGDFETGSAAPWNTYGNQSGVVAEAAHSGDYGLKMVGDGGWGGTGDQNFTTEAGKSYKVTMWIKTIQNGVNIQIQDMGATVAGAWINNAAEWTQLTYEFTATGTASKINFCGGGNGLATTVYVDDIKVKEMIDPSNDGYITNGDFETGESFPWENLWDKNTLEIVEGKDGGSALSIVSGQWQHVRQTAIAVEANADYKVTLWAKNANNMSLLIKDGGDSTDIKNAGISAGDEWTEFTVEFNSGDYTSVIVSLMGGEGEDQYGIFDNVKMEKVETPVEPPVEPEEPVEGSKENPYQIPKPSMLPTEVELAPGAAVYYQFPALKFTNWTLSAMNVTAIEVDDVMHTELSLIDRCIKVTLGMDGNLVGFHNETDEAIVATLILEEPVGTMDAPFQMEDGNNDIIVLDGNPYYATYLPTSTGDYSLNVSDYENFETYIDLDQDITTENDRQLLTAETVFTLESYLPIYFVVIPVGSASEITLVATPPAKGTANNPYYLFGSAEIDGGVSTEGDGLWPTSAEGIHYTIFGLDVATLVIEGNATVLYNGVEYVINGRQEFAGAECIELVATSADASSIKMSVQFPEGTYENPKVMVQGANTLPLDDMGNAYYASFTADKDGVLIINPNTMTGLGYTDASNLTSGDYDYVYAGFEGEGASEDNVLTIPVTAGDVVVISSLSILEDDDFNIVAWDLTLYVCYEADHVIGKATCTEAAKCAACGMTEGKALGHKSDAGTVTKKATCKATGTKTYKCTVCGEVLKTETIAKKAHTSDAGTVTKKATCTATGTKTYKCTACGDTLKTEKIAKASHSYKAATCTKPKTCKNCGATSGEKLGHDYEKKVTKATLTKDGTIKNVCERCDYVASKVTTIYKASSIKLSKTSYTYNGKEQKPSVIVKDSKGNTISSSNYTVTYASGRKNAGTYKVTVKMKGNYSGTKELTYTIKAIDVSKCKISLSTTSYTYNGSAKKPAVTVKNASGTKLTTSSYTVTYASGRKNVGTYKVTIKMKGNYTGTKTLTFKINPVKTSISSLTAGTKKLTVKWSKKSTQVTGYEIQYSTSKSFKSVKTKTVSSYKTTSATLSSLKAKTTYYVRVRTYKTVNGKKYYSGWTTVKSAKTK